MREVLAAIGIEIAVGIVLLISILVGFIWRKMEKKLDANSASIAAAHTSIHGLELGVVALQVWKEEHNSADANIHAELKQAAENQVLEVGSFRVESAEQHRALLAAIASAEQGGREGRERLHDKVEGVTKEVAEVNAKTERLLGAFNEQKRAGQAA